MKYIGEFTKEISFPLGGIGDRQYRTWRRRQAYRLGDFQQTV